MMTPPRLARSDLDATAIEPAPIKLGILIRFADGDCRILSSRGNRHRAELLAQRDPLSVIYFVRAKALSLRETVSLFDSEDMRLIALIFPIVKSSELSMSTIGVPFVAASP